MMAKDEEPTPGGYGLGDAILHAVIAIALTWLFFVPGKDFIAEAVKPTIHSLLKPFGLSEPD